MVDCIVCATEHSRYGMSCIQKLWSAQAVLSLYGMLECVLCCEILLLLDMADMNCLLCGRLWNEHDECLVCLFSGCE